MKKGFDVKRDDKTETLSMDVGRLQESRSILSAW